MLMQKVIFSLLISVSLYCGTALDYLNSLRTQTGLPSFASESHLDAAAQNHSAYMQMHNLLQHDEDSTASGFTGATAVDRALYAGYSSRIVGENISYDSDGDYHTSIDGLFSAIYHRFGFLGLLYDEVGVGISNNQKFYTYDMGNKALNQLCQNPSYTGGGLVYMGVCADTTKKIKASDYTAAVTSVSNIAPKLILWPTPDASDIPPVFYEESPDPLPGHSVTGYPVSVQFNNAKVSAAPTVDTFVLNDSNGIALNILTLMRQSNDPNNKFNAYEFALFPEKRLEWGSRYYVELDYRVNGVQESKSWCFATRSLADKADRFYRIENSSNISLNVVSGRQYAIYVVPNDTNDKLGSVSYSYSANTVQLSYIDSNTVVVTLGGSIGAFAEFAFGNGQHIRLNIASADTASTPLHQTCSQSNETDSDSDGIVDSIDTDDDNDGVLDIYDAFPLDPSESIDSDGDGVGNNADRDDDNDGISDSDELSNGLDPLNASDAEADFDGDGFSNLIEISVGSEIRNSLSAPIWTPIYSEGIMIIVPSYR